MISGLPVDLLEKRAAEQRRHLHQTVNELRQSVREKLDVKRNVREHIWPTAGVMTLLGLALGYVVTGIFTRD